MNDKKCNIKTKVELFNYLKITEKQFNRIFYAKRKLRYNTIWLPKKNGGYRIIDVPSIEVKKIQKRILRLFSNYYNPLDVVHGFTSERSIITNACPHVKKKYLLNIDLKDYFNSIHFGRVKGMLMAKPFLFDKDVATKIAHICTNESSLLPQGAPTSPIIANMITFGLDKDIKSFIRGKGIEYTRYSDDLTFSSNSKNTFNEEFDNKINYLVEKNGFQINSKKNRKSLLGDRKEVTGLIVNDFLNVPREYIKELRAIIYNVKKNGVLTEAEKYISKNNSKTGLGYFREGNEKKIKDWFFQVIAGKIGHLKNIRGVSNPTFLSFATDYNNIFGEEYFKVERWSDTNSYIKDRVFKLEFIRNEGNGCEVEVGEGSAVYIGDGVFITAHHVYVKHFDEFDLKRGAILLSDMTHEFEVLYKNPKSDIMIFRVLNYKLESEILIDNHHEYGSSSEVIFVGYPETNDPQCLLKESQVIGSRVFEEQKLWAVDQTIIKGMSGGGVFNKNYDLIGIIVRGNSEEKNNLDRNEFISFRDFPEEAIECIEKEVVGKGKSIFKELNK